MVAPAILFALGMSRQVWDSLPAEDRKRINEQVKKGAFGMAKIIANRAKAKAKKKGKR